MAHSLTRRAFLTRSTLMGCSLAASPLVTPFSFASAPWDNRLVVIILRGGMDGLDVVRPLGDPDLARARPGLLAKESLDLNGFYSLHPALTDLMPLWKAGELGFVQAVAQPYRDKRSHFDGQDLLEAGLGTRGEGGHDGWLNRALQGVPGVTAHTGYAIGRENMLLMQGDAPVSNWSPDVDIGLSAQGLRLLNLTMEDDPVLSATMDEAVRLAGEDGDGVVIEHEAEMMATMKTDSKGRRRSRAHLRIADFAAAQLARDTRVASFSLGGWDTHANQSGAINKPLSRLAETILRLQEGVGPEVWGKTTILAMTEFGRTVRENGTRGTDHGTGGLMVMAGGSIRGGQVYGQWPGLSEEALYDRRDLMPTDDVRRWAAWALRSSFGIGQDRLERNIFPGIDLGEDPKLLL